MRHFLIFQKFTFLRLYMGLPCIHNIRTSKALDGSIGKLQCAEYGRKAAFFQALFRPILRLKIKAF